jgi:rod shape-determining protein MreC
LVIVAAVVVISLSLTLTNLEGAAGAPFAERAAITVFGPFQRAVNWIADAGGVIWNDYIALVDLKQENERLRRHVDRLTFENNALLERAKQLSRLGALLADPMARQFPHEVAQVIARDTTNRVRIVILNKGSNQGVAVGMPVITHQGLVGRVVRAAPDVSKCLLVSDIRSAVDAIAQESREQMVAVGANGENLEIRYLSVDADIHDGDRVVTSGLGGLFPAGLLIGELHNVRAHPDSLFMEGELIPSVDLSRLEEALILKVDLFSPEEMRERLANEPQEKTP